MLLLLSAVCTVTLLIMYLLSDLWHTSPLPIGPVTLMVVAIRSVPRDFSARLAVRITDFRRPGASRTPIYANFGYLLRGDVAVQHLVNRGGPSLPSHVAHALRSFGPHVLPTPPSIHSDHLNSINVVHNPLSPLPNSPLLRSLPARSYYKWLLAIINDLSTSLPPSLRPSFHHVKAHTSSTTSAAIANRLADKLASSSHDILLLFSPVPTFIMAKFSFHCPSLGFVDSSPTSFLPQIFAHAVCMDPLYVPARLLQRDWYDQHEPPAYPYTRTFSDYSGRVRLYARSSQLATGARFAARSATTNDLCPFGCPAFDNEHHKFVECPQFTHLRLAALDQLVSETATLIDKSDLTPDSQSQILSAGQQLFNDGDLWPQYLSTFYLGLVPDIHTILPTATLPCGVSRTRLLPPWRHCGTSRAHTLPDVFGVNIHADTRNPLPRFIHLVLCLFLYPHTCQIYRLLLQVSKPFFSMTSIRSFAFYCYLCFLLPVFPPTSSSSFRITY